MLHGKLMRVMGTAILALAALPSAFHFIPTLRPAVMRHAIDERKNLSTKSEPRQQKFANQFRMAPLAGAAPHLGRRVRGRNQINASPRRAATFSAAPARPPAPAGRGEMRVRETRISIPNKYSGPWSRRWECLDASRLRRCRLIF
ncbi:hypothetical protein EVAR_52636_1 [Eumeta japonica]|uniref:Uncharacterized protein n=1 Tax=Eumeta variegata TaxID=151549 RepID=A0A4C1Y255_EUMVA|nr:hypothetical protein EVAR_52636_1 [Eumeta japonica]